MRYGKVELFKSEYFSRAPTLDEAIARLRLERSRVTVYPRYAGGFWLVDYYNQYHLLPAEQASELGDLIALETGRVGTLAERLSGDTSGETSRRFEAEMASIRAAHIATRTPKVKSSPSIDDLLADL